MLAPPLNLIPPKQKFLDETQSFYSPQYTKVQKVCPPPSQLPPQAKLPR